METGFIKKSKVNILIIIIIITVLSAGILSIYNTRSLNRNFSSIINKDIPDLRIISEISLNISDARIEIYRYVAGYEPSPYLITNSFTNALKKITMIEVNQMPDNIISSFTLIKSNISKILELSHELEITLKRNNSLKKAELSSNLLMQSSMLVALSDNLRNTLTDYIILQQIKSKTDLLKTNAFFSVFLFIFLMLLLLFAAFKNKILLGIVKQRTKSLENQIFQFNLVKNNLQESEKRFENLYNNTPVSYFSLDETGIIMDVNKTWLEILFYDKENVINHPMTDFIYAEDISAFNDIFKELLSRQRILNKEIRLINQYDEIMNTSFTASIDEYSGYFYCVFYDITEQKGLEDQLIHSEKMIAIGQLAGGIAHDFNNQLAGIMGYTELIKLETDNKITNNYADNILRITNRASELVKQLLIFARKEQQVKYKTDIHKLLKEVEALVKRSIDRKIILEIFFNAEDSVITCDPGQIVNAFLNLAINSRDAMPDGGKIIIKTESVFLNSNSKINNISVKPGFYIKTTFEDTGAGIPDTLKNKIFEPFFTTKSTGKGTGMGLSIVYSTVKNHDGVIDIYNKKGSGAVFSIYLPQTFEKIDNETKSKKYRTIKSNGNYTILIVEDEKMLREMVSEAISKEKYKIISAEDGAQALKIFKDKWKEIDLVLLDLFMPKVNGYDTFIGMKSINPEVKVIITTGYSFNNNIQDMIKKGVKDIIMKPYTLSDLFEKMINTLEKN